MKLETMFGKSIVTGATMEDYARLIKDTCSTEDSDALWDFDEDDIKDIDDNGYVYYQIKVGDEMRYFETYTEPADWAYKYLDKHSNTLDKFGRLLQIFQQYIDKETDNRLISAVREDLEKYCSMTQQEAEEFGIGYVFDVE